MNRIKNRQVLLGLYIVVFILVVLVFVMILFSKKSVKFNKDTGNNIPLEFLSEFVLEDGTFLSRRLAYITPDGDLEQTYYHLLIHELLNLPVSDDLVKTFEGKVYSNFEPYNYKYLSYSLRNNFQRNRASVDNIIDMDYA